MTDKLIAWFSSSGPGMDIVRDADAALAAHAVNHLLACVRALEDGLVVFDPTEETAWATTARAALDALYKDLEGM